MKFIFFICIISLNYFGYSQELSWTGNANNSDFFDEENWIDNSTTSSPSAGTLDPNNAIDLDLYIQNSNDISANGIINLGSGSLTLQEVNLSADAISNGLMNLKNEAYVDLSSSSPLLASITIDLKSSLAWVRTLDLKPFDVNSSLIDNITVNQQAASYQNNLRSDNYYANGTVIRSEDTANPIIIYSGENHTGNSAGVGVYEIYSDTNIPGGLNNAIKSFVLKKGHMATFAVNEDGTGKSKNYIASEEDLVVDKLPMYLRNKISFIRVLPWNWVTKKGRGGGGTSTFINNTWFYHWNNTMDSTSELEYAPMAWGAGGANSDAAIQNYLTKDKSTHVLAFNESDNCNDQSGQYNNLCQVDVAVDLYKNLMKTGMRLVSPNGRENAPFGWLKEFYDKATEQDIRIDVIGVHWYDWGSNPTSSPNANPNQVFQRFKKYLEDVYNLYGLPIWVTEFNANPNRTNEVNYEFMKLALPYLESLDYVERYAWFEPFSGTADYTDDNGNLTNVGTFIANHQSSPSIPEVTLSDNNNLDNLIDLIDPTGENLIYNGFFETGDLKGWEGNNIAILNNAFEGDYAGRIMANPGSLFQNIEVEPNTIYDLSFYTKWFVPPSEAIDAIILNTVDNSIIKSQQMTTSTQWNLIQFEFITPSDVSEIKFLIEKGNEPGWFIDSAILLKVETLSNNQPKLSNSIKVFPNPSKGIFNIRAQENLSSIQVFNSQGKMVRKTSDINKQEVGINLDDLRSGVYILKSINEYGNQNVQKLIKN